MGGPRYAVCYTPQPWTPLGGFGAAVLGYDCFSGTETPKAPVQGLPVALAESVTRAPAIVGFHAPVVGPFRLKRHSESDLCDELLLFTKLHAPVPLGELVVTAADSSIALVPVQPPAKLEVLTTDCIQALAGFHGEPRKQRFSLTIAEPVAARDVEAVRAALARQYARLGTCFPEFDALSLLRQDDEEGRFRLIERFRLQGRF